MDFHPASPASLVPFVTIVVAVIAAFLCAVHYACRSTKGKLRGES